GHWHLCLCDLTQSEIYLEINMCRDAIRFAEAGYKEFESIQKPIEMAKAVGVMAIAHRQRREYRQAGRLFEKARSMMKAQARGVSAGHSRIGGRAIEHRGRRTAFELSQGQSTGLRNVDDDRSAIGRTRDAQGSIRNGGTGQVTYPG